VVLHQPGSINQESAPDLTRERPAAHELPGAGRAHAKDLGSGMDLD
jgi:hypothetical protein